MADQPKRPPKAPDPKRFDLEAEKTVNATDEELAKLRVLQNRAAEEAKSSQPDLTVPGSEPPRPAETLLGDVSSPNLGPGSTFDNLSEETSIPPAGARGKPSATAMFDDEEDEDEDATQAVSVSAQTPTPAPAPKPKTGKSPAHVPAKRIDVQSGQNRAHRPKPKPAPMDADAFEPVVGGSLELSSTTARDLHASQRLLHRVMQESLPVKLGLAAAILSLTAFVIWLVFLAAR